MNNHWISGRNALAYWHIHFPKQVVISHPESLITFAEELLDICYRTHIFQLDSFVEPPFYRKASNGHYIADMKATFEATGAIPFFDFSDVPAPYAGM